MTVILTDRPTPTPLPPGKCACGAAQEKWRALLGGREVCMGCGAEREAV
jgi:hypothetical protein